MKETVVMTGFILEMKYSRSENFMCPGGNRTRDLALTSQMSCSRELGWDSCIGKK
jgi:hypothetical protein